MKQILVIVLATAIVVGGGAFYGGMKYGENKTPQGLSQAERQQRLQQLGAAGMGFLNGRVGNQTGGSFTNGEILSRDDKSITVKLQNGSSKIVFFSESTEIGKFTNGTSTDLEVGKSVTVTGTANQDGSLTAKSIQIRPSLPTNQ